MGAVEAIWSLPRSASISLRLMWMISRSKSLEHSARKIWSRSGRAPPVGTSV